MTFYELENICKKRKKYFIMILIFLLIIILLVVGVIFYFSFSKNSLKKKNINELIYNKKVIEINSTKKSFIKKEKKIKKIKKVKKKINKIIQKDVKYLPIIDLNITEVNGNSNNHIMKQNIKNISNSNKEQNKSSLIIKTNVLPSFDTCIELSKKYFNEKKYEQALKWAKFANLQNKKDPISWIMAAKALYKLGKKEEAIKLLKIYNSYYNNKKINNLLKELNEK